MKFNNSLDGILKPSLCGKRNINTHMIAKRHLREVAGVQEMTEAFGQMNTLYQYVHHRPNCFLLASLMKIRREIQL